jgi:hypothetical protein
VSCFRKSLPVGRMPAARHVAMRLYTACEMLA